MIKNKIYGKFRDLSITELLDKIKSPLFDLEYMSTEVKYNIKKKFKKGDIERYEKIVIFDNKDILNLMKDKNNIEYSIDFTF